MSPSPCRGASTASDIINPKSSSEGPILPMTRPSTIPMLPTNHNQLASHEAIQVATVVDTSGSTPKSYDFDQHQYNICSSQALCGPHPKKVVIVIAIILSIWASFILGINIHKKVLTMEDKLASMTQKMLDLQIKYLDLQVASNEEITRLHHKVNDLTEKSLQKGTIFFQFPIQCTLLMATDSRERIMIWCVILKINRRNLRLHVMNILLDFHFRNVIC